MSSFIWVVIFQVELWLLIRAEKWITLTNHNCCYNYCCVKIYWREIHVLSDSEVQCPGFFLNFFPVSVTDFQNVLRPQWVTTLRHSIGFQCNLVHEQTTFFPISCSLKIYDLFLSFCTILAFLKMAFCRLHDEYWRFWTLNLFGHIFGQGNVSC